MGNGTCRRARPTRGTVGAGELGGRRARVDLSRNAASGIVGRATVVGLPDRKRGNVIRINFLLPFMNQSGGNRVVERHASLLAALGHRVTIVSPPPPTARSLSTALRRFAKPSYRLSTNGSDVELRLLDRFRPIRNDDVPSSDVTIATWWETAEWLLALDPSKGRKVYFIQGYEVYPWLPQARCHATYRMPLKKIVVSQWLERIMRDQYGDDSVDVVPNAVDHEVFYSSPRAKQPRPTIGLLHSLASFKGLDVAFAALERVRQVMPDLRVLMFGIEKPTQALPEYMEFAFDPSPSILRRIYCSCDLWLSASRSEGFNLTTMEAMACRTPVVATRTGWPADAIRAGFNGACVEIDDAAALAREAERLLSLSESGWLDMSEGAFKTVEHSSWTRSAELFERALSRHVGALRPAMANE